jgi:magnesium-transporting ATPase (P-type)
LALISSQQIEGGLIAAVVGLNIVVGFVQEYAAEKTEESLPVHKIAETIFNEEPGPGDRLNIVYRSSTVTKALGYVAL